MAFISRKKTVAGVILAAGGSERMGVPKQLLLWNNRPFLICVLEATISTDLFPLYVVLGSHSETIKPIIKEYPISILNNPDWKQGLSTSVSLAIKTLPNSVDGVLFLLGDQPFIPAALIQEIIHTFENTEMSIVAPKVDNKRGNPVLFSRSLFDELLSIKGDSGGRSLLARFPVEWVYWDDPSILVDIDTHDDYDDLKKKNIK